MAIMARNEFSRQARSYAQFRPRYPKELYDFLLSLVPGKSKGWDCATGNGQVASTLSAYFEKIIATDISSEQLKNAFPAPNVEYRIEPAEKVSFGNEEFDLVTVGQAIHWFDFEKFYAEVTRVLKPGGVIAAFGYARSHISPEIDRIVLHLYNGILQGYWDERRQYVEDQYRTIPFPFTEIAAPPFSVQYDWTADDFLGFLETWSAVQNFIEEKRQNPLRMIEEDLRKEWNAISRVTFPVFARVGKKP